MDALYERRFLHPVLGSVVMLMVVTMMTFDLDDGRRSADEGKDLVPILAFLVGNLCRVDSGYQGETEHFTECVGQFHRLFADGGMAGTTNFAT